MTETSPTSTPPSPPSLSRHTLTPAQRRYLIARADWRRTARPDQLTPTGTDWFAWLILAGRGYGKTRCLVEDGAKYAAEHPGHRIAIVAQNYGDARYVLLEGESGLLSVLRRYGLLTSEEQYNRSSLVVTCSNGTQFHAHTAEKPDSLRGYQYHRALCDELAAWPRPDTWDQLQMTLRLPGARPQVVIATTPRPVPLVRQLLGRADRDVRLTRGSTFDNAANLAPTFLEQVREQYDGTRLGRQELYAEVLDDVEGALWTPALIDGPRVQRVPELQRVVVAVDPAVTSSDGSDETGIVAAGITADGHIYVLADRSTRDSPHGWMRRALLLYEDVDADRLVAETNQGGDLVESVLRTVPGGSKVAYRKVTATRGKRLRAEPVAALYEQGRVHHVGRLPELEEQLLTWTPDAGGSPDRLDALVWAITDLALGRRKGFAAVA